MSDLSTLRDLLHRRYTRAAVVGLSLAAIVCSVSALALCARHGVPLASVVRYFARPHLDEENLSSLLRHRETGSRLEALLGSSDPSRWGGLVYADDHGLTFYPHATTDLDRNWRQERENRRVYARLVSLYHGGRVGDLHAALREPAITDGLHRRGVEAAELAALGDPPPDLRTEADEVRFLRRLGRLIHPFTPNDLSPAWLDLGRKLDFYRRKAPMGRFVGQFAIVERPWGPWLDESFAHELSRHNHYLLIASAGDRILLLDFYRGMSLRYELTPFDHLTGQRLYRLAVAG